MVDLRLGWCTVAVNHEMTQMIGSSEPLTTRIKGLQHGRRLRLSEYTWSVGIIALATVVGLRLRAHLQIIDVAMLYLLAVVVVGYRYRRGPALLASLLSIAAFDLGFVPPYYTFNVHDTAYYLTFGVMLSVALSMGQLTARIREQAQDASEREGRARAMYALSKGLAEGGDLEDQLRIAARHISEVGRGEAELFLVGNLLPGDWPVEGLFESLDVRIAAIWAYENGECAGWGTRHCAGAEALVVPLRSPSRMIGVVIVHPRSLDDVLPEPEQETVEALAEQAAAAFERTILSREHEQARVEVESERLRTALLSSLSHDLRTPLGSIEGAASSLLQESGGLSREAQQEMAETILEESRRMTRLVTNLLDMVRVETGALAVHKEWQPLEEALGVALVRLEDRLVAHSVETRLPPDLPLVPIDELLVEQVFINLLENAAKHTPRGTSITVSAWTEGESVIVEVADCGPGIPIGEEETVFRKFHRTAGVDHTGPAGGSGLGLTICRGIIAAHGGRMWLEPSPSEGARFRFSLPLVGPPLRGVPTEAVES
jgi:two-component system sensor histidine kinase KdpD